MDIQHPIDGATLSISQAVVFSGTAGPTAVTVKLFADGTIALGQSPVVNGKWMINRLFSAKGARKITLHGFDSAGNDVAQTSITINLVDASSLGHHLPPGVGTHLGDIALQLETATPMEPGFQHLEFMCKLSGGELYFESDLDLDTDGVKEPGITYEGSHQDQVSIGGNVNANRCPYFVLPGNFFSQHHIKLGDVAAILYRDKIEFAVFADTGPVNKIGEASIAVHRSLGFERVKNGHIVNAGIDSGVVTIVFPGSGNGTVQTPDAIRTIGRQKFLEIGGVV